MNNNYYNRRGRNNNKSNTKRFVLKQQQTKRLRKYDMEFVYEVSYHVKSKLPLEAVRVLTMSNRIQYKINEEDKLKMVKEIDNFDKETLQKKINSDLNKLSEKNFDLIFTKINEMLKNREVLIEYSINNLINKALLQPLFIELYAKFYSKIYNKETHKIFNNVFNDLLNVMNQKMDENKNYDTFCKYIKDKSRFSNLFLLVSKLYKFKIISKDMVKYYLNFLEKSIEEKGNEECVKYVEAYVKFLLDLKEVEYYKKDLIEQYKTNKEKFKPRIRFMFMDLNDFFLKFKKEKNVCLSPSTFTKSNH
jgi:hypothetical protein